MEFPLIRPDRLQGATQGDEVEIWDASDDAVSEYGIRYGTQLVRLSQAHIDALQQGKMLAWNDSEYSTFVILGD
jgi:hypothetical protein